MRVLLTRSDLQNTVFRQLIESQYPALKIVEVPMLEQVQIDSQGKQLTQFLADVDVDEAIFISPSAVEFGAQRIVENLKLSRYFTVGKGTAMVLEKQLQALHCDGDSQQACDVVFPQHSTGSEALLELKELQQIQDKSLMIVTGTQGKPLLEHALLNRGAKVSRWECYQRQKPADLHAKLEQAFSQSIHYVMLHSAHAAQHFLQELPMHSHSKEMTLLVGAQSIAEVFANSKWQDQLLIADSPMPNDMLRCLMSNLNF